MQNSNVREKNSDILKRVLLWFVDHSIKLQMSSLTLYLQKVRILYSKMQFPDKRFIY